MALRSIEFHRNDNCWESSPVKCAGGDMRVRIHKKGPYPVDVLVSIDGVEEYIRHDAFGLDETKSEITVEGALCGQYLKFVSRSEFTLIKCLEM